MIKIPMDICMKTLDGFIKDEDKLVTYKWFSNEMEIHVNVAKQILEEYWNKHKNDGIVATIMIIGYLKDGEMRVEVVKESNLADATKKYNKIISQHIYSVQKTLLDIELLAGVGNGDAKYGAIHCEKSVLLSDEELFARRWGAATTFHAPQEERKPPVDKTADAKKSNGIGKFLKESTENKKPAEEKETNKQEEKLEDKKISPPKSKVSPKKVANPKKNVQSQKTGFSNLFGKVSAANQKKSPPSTSNNKNTSTEKKSMLMKENVDNRNNFVEKSATKQGIKSPEIEKKSSTDDKSSKDEKSTGKEISPKGGPVNNTEQSTSAGKKSVTDTVPESKSSKNKKTIRGTKRERSQDSNLDAKKRKRIVMVSDSSDESAASDEEMICDSPPREEIVEIAKSPSPPPVRNINGKRKVRKLVNKTFMDEDGYLVTKKEQVYESCSEEEEPVKVPESKTIITEPPAKVMKKQTTLMNFFKKA